MAGGLAALLDDVAMIAKMASSASTKAVAVVVDDAAVTPRYVTGFSPARELPMIWKITKGSLRNKLLFILPVALLLSEFAPWLLPPLLMLGGAYLCYEGAEKIFEAVTGHHEEQEPVPPSQRGSDYEDQMVRGAITTDFILSAEIMVISLNSIAEAAFWPRAITLVVVGIALTALVYGVVALLVKMDDIGLKMMEGDGGSARFGRFLVDAMPKIMNVLSIVGVVAMLWVGGHILIAGVADLGWHTPEHILHAITEPVARVAGVGGVLAWLVETLISALVGLALGALVLLVVHLLPLGKKHNAPDHEVESKPAPDRD